MFSVGRFIKPYPPIRSISTATGPSISTLLSTLASIPKSRSYEFIERFPTYVPKTPLPLTVTQKSLRKWTDDVASEILANIERGTNITSLESQITGISRQFHPEGMVPRIAEKYRATIPTTIRSAIKSGHLKPGEKVNLERFSGLVRGLPKSTAQIPKALKKELNMATRLSAQFVPGSTFSTARMMLNVIVSAGNYSDFLKAIADSRALPASLLNEVYALLRYYMEGGEIKMGDNHEHSIAVRIAGYVLLGATHYLQQLGYTKEELQAIMPYVLESYGKAISDESLVTPQRGMDNNLCTRATNNFINGLSIEEACMEAAHYGATTTFEKGAKAGTLKYPTLLTGENNLLGIKQVAGTEAVYAASFTEYYRNAFTIIGEGVLERTRVSFNHPGNPRIESGVREGIELFQNVVRDILRRTSGTMIGGAFEVTNEQAKQLGSVFALAISDIILDNDPNDELKLTNSQTHISESVEVEGKVKLILDKSKETEIIQDLYDCGVIFQTTCLDSIPKRELFPKEANVSTLSYIPVQYNLVEYKPVQYNPPIDYTKLHVNPISPRLRGPMYRFRGGTRKHKTHKRYLHRSRKAHPRK